MRKIGLKTGAWTGAISLVIGGGVEVSGAGDEQAVVQALGWLAIAVGLGVLIWGVTINGRPWWDRKPKSDADNLSEPKGVKGEFALNLRGERAAFVGNEVTGYNEVSLTDEGQDNLLSTNNFSKGSVSPYDLAKYPDGSSSLTRIDRIVTHILGEIAPNIETEVKKRRPLSKKTIKKINKILAEQGEAWKLDHSLVKRLRYDDEQK